MAIRSRVAILSPGVVVKFSKTLMMPNAANVIIAHAASLDRNHNPTAARPMINMIPAPAMLPLVANENVNQAEAVIQMML